MSENWSQFTQDLQSSYTLYSTIQQDMSDLSKGGAAQQAAIQDLESIEKGQDQAFSNLTSSPIWAKFAGGLSTAMTSTLSNITFTIPVVVNGQTQNIQVLDAQGNPMTAAEYVAGASYQINFPVTYGQSISLPCFDGNPDAQAEFNKIVGSTEAGFGHNYTWNGSSGPFTFTGHSQNPTMNITFNNSAGMSILTPTISSAGLSPLTNFLATLL